MAFWIPLFVNIKNAQKGISSSEKFMDVQYKQKKINIEQMKEDKRFLELISACQKWE